MTAVYLSNNLTHWYTQGGGSGATFDGCKKMYFVNEYSQLDISFEFDKCEKSICVYIKEIQKILE
jgi:hypothetical protein